MSKSGHELWISLDRMTELTKQDHAFFWKIDNDPSTPDEMDLFPLAYNERKVAQSFPQGIEAASQT